MDIKSRAFFRNSGHSSVQNGEFKQSHNLNPAKSKEYQHSHLFGKLEVCHVNVNVILVPTDYLFNPSG